ncbi:MAG: DNA mismatch repair protein, partial [Flavobacterium sp.]
MEVYKKRSKTFSEELTKINKKYNTISFFRLLSIVLFLLTLYYYFQTEKSFLIVLGVLFFAFFIILMRFHTKLVFQKELKEALVAINNDEATYLNREKIPFENGQEFNDFSHPYAYDLDIYGEHSLFQNLNRTTTFVGKKTLAEQLLTIAPNLEILRNQEAVKELSQKLDWRQEFMALAKISHDSKSLYETLLKWGSFSSSPLSKVSSALSFISPALLAASFLAYLVTSNPVFLSVLSLLFALNLAILGNFYKRISIEIANAENIDKIINQYSLIVHKIETESFQSEKLKDLQLQLNYKNETSSIHLKQLSALFSRMDSIGNLVTTIIFNGTFLFHLHNLRALIQWKKDHAEALIQWLEVIGEFDMLNSLANFSYNNPQFVFPTLNTNYEISFSNLNHPLLNEKTRIGNDVNFQPQSFMILTGSNMSGKSTFLRSLGINMVLA